MTAKPRAPALRHLAPPSLKAVPAPRLYRCHQSPTPPFVWLAGERPSSARASFGMRVSDVAERAVPARPHETAHTLLQPVNRRTTVRGIPGQLCMARSPGLYPHVDCERTEADHAPASSATPRRVAGSPRTASNHEALPLSSPRHIAASRPPVPSLHFFHP